MNIVLIGYMGSGKSLIGKELASKNHLKFIDLDAYIEKNENQTISELFSNKGHIYFRLKESEYLKDILTNNHNIVLSLGGGTPCYGNNLDLINNYSISIYLKTSIKILSNRLMKEKYERPLIANLSDDKLEEFIGKHLFERGTFYEKANFSVLTDNKTIIDILSEIELFLNLNKQ